MQTIANNNANGAITVLEIDLAKQSFQLHGVDRNSQIVIKKKSSRIDEVYIFDRALTMAKIQFLRNSDDN